MTQLANIEQMSPAQLDFLQQQIFAHKQTLLQRQVEELAEENAKLKAVMEIKSQEIEQIKHQVDNWDLTNIQGSARDRLNKMIRLYAGKKGIQFNQGYRDFVQAYNTAFHTNLELRVTNYCKNTGIKQLTTPDYLERTERLEDAIRVVDKMLNKRIS